MKKVDANILIAKDKIASIVSTVIAKLHIAKIVITATAILAQQKKNENKN
jgi:hypothetical protein